MKERNPVNIRVLESRADVELLVNSFYDKVKEDALLAPLFAHVDWPEHLPVMYKFWASMLLGEQSYQGGPFEKHKNLPLQPEHFQQWLKLFRQTVDEHFTGEVAEEAKRRGEHIGNVFQYKMGLMR